MPEPGPMKVELEETLIGPGSCNSLNFVKKEIVIRRVLGIFGANNPA